MTDNQVTIGPKPLGAVQENEEDEVSEFIGFLSFSTTGEALVPRDWLLDQWENYDLPKSLLPKKPSNWSAYRRMKNELLEDADYKHYQIYSDEYGRNFNCKFALEKSDKEGSNTYLLYSEVFYPEEIIGEDGGDWRRTRMGYMNFYRPEDDAPGQLVTNFEEVKGTAHWEHVKRLGGRAFDLFQTMQTHNNYSDLQKIIDQFRYEANAVPIRRAVYFVGSHHQDTVEGLGNLWRDMNEFKEKGEKMRVETTPVVNIESQREMVAERVRERVNDLVDEIVNETLSRFEEDDDMTAENTSREILKQLSDSYDIAGEYNELLSLRLSIKDILEERREELVDEQEEIIDKVINQNSLEDY